MLAHPLKAFLSSEVGVGLGLGHLRGPRARLVEVFCVLVPLIEAGSASTRAFSALLRRAAAKSTVSPGANMQMVMLREMPTAPVPRINIGRDGTATYRAGTLPSTLSTNLIKFVL